ncbi:MAG: hypothetical protein ABJE10_23585 [bacterium]
MTAPQGAEKALVGVIDGVYTFTINPAIDQSIKLGASRLDLPASSVCALATSSYGPTAWDSSCDREKLPVVITAVVKNAATTHPSVEFSPAMRFAPDKNVQLYLYVTDAATLTNMTVMKYCGPFNSVCVDESVVDKTLSTTVDKTAQFVSRRIKHFSGYVVAENGDGITGGQ